MTDVPQKVCTKCGKDKPLSDFSGRNDAKDGLRHECRVCHAARSKTIYGQNKDRHRRCGTRWKVLNPIKMMLIIGRARAKKKKVPFTVTESDIHIPDRCPVFDIELARGSGRAASSSPSLDRIIPGIGYVAKPYRNISVISNRANTLKGDATPIESMQIALYQAKNQQDRIEFLESEVARLKAEIESRRML